MNKNKSRLDSNSPVFNFSGGVILSVITTMVANAYFDVDCRLSNYQGNLFFIFIATWISLMGMPFFRAKAFRLISWECF